MSIKKFKFYWLALALAMGATMATSAMADTNWTLQGSNIYNTNSGNVGIGTTTPTSLLMLEAPSGNAIETIQADASGGAANLTLNSGSSQIPSIYFNIAGATYGELTRTTDSVLRLETNWPGNSIAFDTKANVEAMRVSFSGNVGIGTTSPAAILHVQAWSQNSANTTIPLLVQATTTAASTLPVANFVNGSGSSLFSVLTGGNVGVGTTTPSSRLFVQGVSGTSAFTVASSSPSTTFLTVAANGNVGIGTSTPTQALDVKGNINLSGNITSNGDICIGTCP